MKKGRREQAQRVCSQRPFFIDSPKNEFFGANFGEIRPLPQRKQVGVSYVRSQKPNIAHRLIKFQPSWKPPHISPANKVSPAFSKAAGGGGGRRPLPRQSATLATSPWPLKQKGTETVPFCFHSSSAMTTLRLLSAPTEYVVTPAMPWTSEWMIRLS